MFPLCRNTIGSRPVPTGSWPVQQPSPEQWELIYVWPPNSQLPPHQHVARFTSSRNMNSDSFSTFSQRRVCFLHQASQRDVKLFPVTFDHDSLKHSSANSHYRYWTWYSSEAHGYFLLVEYEKIWPQASCFTDAPTTHFTVYLPACFWTGCSQHHQPLRPALMMFLHVHKGPIT